MRGLRDKICQRPDPVARFACRDAFQNFAHGEEENDQRRLFGRIDEQRADGSDGHQAFDGKWLPHPQCRKGTLRHRGHADQTGRDEGPFADLGRKIFDDPGGTQQKGSEDHQPTLGRLKPPLAPVSRVVMDMAGATVAGLVLLGAGCL